MQFPPQLISNRNNDGALRIAGRTCKTACRLGEEQLPARHGQARVTADKLSPRQRECLRLVWQKQATSKEIAAELGISKTTVDGYIAEAVELLGARDRRSAAAIAFADVPRTVSGPDPARVAAGADDRPSVGTSTEAGSAPRPWRTRERPLNTLTLAQTLGWIAIIAVGSIAALALAMAVGNGLPSVALPVLHAFDRLTH